MAALLGTLHRPVLSPIRSPYKDKDLNPSEYMKDSLREVLNERLGNR